MSRDSLLVDGRIHDRKVASSNRGRSGGRIFFCGVNFTCRLLFGVCSVSVLPHWHVKDPGHSVKSAGSRLHLNMHTPFIQRSQSGLTLLLSRHSVHNNIDVMTKFCLRPGTSFDWYLCLQTSTASDEVTYSCVLGQLVLGTQGGSSPSDRRAFAEQKENFICEYTSMDNIMYS